LCAVICQTLCKRIGGGRAAAREVLFNTPAVANLIRERKTFQVQSIMQTSKRTGMTTLTDALVDLVTANVIAADEALINASDKSALTTALRAKGIEVPQPDVDAPEKPGLTRWSIPRAVAV